MDAKAPIYDFSTFEKAMKAAEAVGTSAVEEARTFNRAKTVWREIERAHYAAMGANSKLDTAVAVARKYGPAVAKYFGVPVTAGMVSEALGVFQKLGAALGLGF